VILATSSYASGTTSYVTGFGLTSGTNDNSDSDQIKVVSIPLVSLSTCQTVLNQQGLDVKKI
jgi:hypothetical protein